jgi:membrane-associated phospholipid phosphatase
LKSDRRLSAPAFPLALALGALGLFALLTVSAVAGGPRGWDRLLFRHLYSGEWDWAGGTTPGQSNPVLNAAEPTIYRLANARLLVLFAALVVVTLILLGRRRSAAFFTAALAVTALVPVLKQLVDSPSPFPRPDDPSFPSGHATGSMAVAAGIVALVGSSRWRWLAIVVGAIFVTTVGMAVVADSGHWPSDVLAGWCLALAWVAALTLMARHWRERAPTRQGQIRAPRSRATRPAEIDGAAINQ